MALDRIGGDAEVLVLRRLTPNTQLRAKRGMPKANAHATRMAASRALFDELSPLARRRWSIDRIAAYCGVSHGTVSRWLEPGRTHSSDRRGWFSSTQSGRKAEEFLAKLPPLTTGPRGAARP
jgi:hypothetical protein